VGAEHAYPQISSLEPKEKTINVSKHWRSIVTGILALLISTPIWGQIDTISYVKYWGKIVVGVNADYKPFGYTDSTGKIVGLEIDLAKDVAKRLHVGIELVPVLAANRIEFLKEGRIFLIIATMAYGQDRTEMVEIPEPFYYASAANMFAKKSSGLKNWEDLKGKPVCAVQGFHDNRRAGDEFGAHLIVFKRAPEAMLALERGSCVGVVFDAAFFAGIMDDPKWTDYGTVLPLIDPEPWAVAVRKGDTKFAAYMSDVIKDWHRTGFILKLQKKWGLPESAFLAEQHAEYK